MGDLEHCSGRDQTWMTLWKKKRCSCAKVPLKNESLLPCIRRLPLLFDRLKKTIVKEMEKLPVNENKCFIETKFSLPSGQHHEFLLDSSHFYVFSQLLCIMFYAESGLSGESL